MQRQRHANSINSVKLYLKLVKGIAAYTEADGTLLLYAKGEDNLIGLERKLGLIKE